MTSANDLHARDEADVAGSDDPGTRTLLKMFVLPAFTPGPEPA